MNDKPTQSFVGDITNNITDDLVTSFIHIPYEVLLYYIFPNLSVKTIDSLCPVNSLFNDLCNDEALWKIKISNEYPSLLTKKPDNISWRNYYRTQMTKTVPVYYHGDPIFQITFVEGEFKDTIEPIIKNFSAVQRTDDNLIKQIAFINKSRELIVGIQYPNMLIKNFNPTDKEITKIIIIDGEKLDLLNSNFSNQILNLSNLNFGEGQRGPAIGGRGSRGGKTGDNIGESIETNQFVSNDDVIFNELTSLLGKPPIYGIYFDDFFEIIDNDDWSHINDRKRHGDMSEPCGMFMPNDFGRMLSAFGKYVAGLDDDDDYYYFGLRRRPNYSNEKLCKMLELEIIAAGHVI